MIKRSGLSFLLQPGPGPQIRSAEIRKQNSCTHTCLQPTHMARRRSDTYIPSESVLICVCRWTVEAGERGSIEHPEVGSSEIHNWARRVKPKKKKKNSPEKNPEEHPPPLPKTYTHKLPPCIHHCPAPPLFWASTDQHMWWRMTHLFFYKGCVYVKLLKCIKMSSALGGPPRLPWKITRWKYNFSFGATGVWTGSPPPPTSRSLPLFHTHTHILLFFAVTLIFFPVFVVVLACTQAHINRFCNRIKWNKTIWSLIYNIDTVLTTRLTFSTIIANIYHSLREWCHGRLEPEQIRILNFGLFWF